MCPDLAGMDLLQAPLTAEGVSPSSIVVDVPVAVIGGQPSTGDVAAMISATMLMKRKRAAKPPFQAQRRPLLRRL
jgi:hypothetical protein